MSAKAREWIAYLVAGALLLLSWALLWLVGNPTWWALWYLGWALLALVIALIALPLFVLPGEGQLAPGNKGDHHSRRQWHVRSSPSSPLPGLDAILRCPVSLRSALAGGPGGHSRRGLGVRHRCAGGASHAGQVWGGVRPLYADCAQSQPRAGAHPPATAQKERMRRFVEARREGGSMEDRSSADGWFVRRIMKLTPFEKWLMERPQRIEMSHRAALRLFPLVELPPRPYCLEIGCGQGVMTQLLVERFAPSLVAIDFDADQVAAARTRLAHVGDDVELHVVDARDMPFPDAQFDAVFSFGVLHHLIRDWCQAVSEASRVLRPGGWFVCTDLLPPRWLEHLLGPLLRRVELLAEKPLRSSLSDNGLRITHFTAGGASVVGLMRHCSLVARKSTAGWEAPDSMVPSVDPRT